MTHHTHFDGKLPSDFGLPAKFKEFRDIQREMAEVGTYGLSGDNSNRFVFIGAPTGAGKSLVANMIGKEYDERYAIVTATKGLQDQYGEFKLADLRGKSNYPCVMQGRMTLGYNERSCEDGEHHGCQWAGGPHCTYGKAYQQAKHSDPLTNYQMWMGVRTFPPKLERIVPQTLDGKLVLPNPIKLVIFDEFHLAPSELSRFLGVFITDRDIQEFGPEKMVREAMRELGSTGKGWDRIRGHCGMLLNSIKTSVEIKRIDLSQAIAYLRGNEDEDDDEEEEQVDRRREIVNRFGTDHITKLELERRRLEKLDSGIGRLTYHMTDNNWLWQVGKSGWKFDCIWPWRYAEQYLFSGIEKVVGMSATLRPKCMSLCGLKRKDYDYKEWPRIFPAHLSPVYYWPVGKLSKKASDEDRAAVYRAIDEIWESRKDRKHMIHSVSYEKGREIQAGCRVAGRHMILSEPGEAATAAEKFRSAGPGAVLCSPSFMTGWDFPGQFCECNIVPKLPYTFRGDPVAQAREDEDPDYESYKVMQDVVQAFGRHVRHETDQGEGFLLDKAWTYFQYLAKEHKPQFFQVRNISRLPRAPARMVVG